MIAAALLAAVALGLVALWWIGRPRGVGQSGDLRLHLIAPDVWMFRGYFSNAFALILPTRVVVIDALISPETATIFRDALARVTRLPITHVIWTHYNGDHVGGTSALAGPGVEIICTEETARLVVERDDERRAYVEAFGLIAHDYPVVPAPTRTFSGTLRLELDGGCWNWQLGAVETSDACVVWWPPAGDRRGRWRVDGRLPLHRRARRRRGPAGRRRVDRLPGAGRGARPDVLLARLPALEGQPSSRRGWPLRAHGGRRGGRSGRARPGRQPSSRSPRAGRSAPHARPATPTCARTYPPNGSRSSAPSTASIRSAASRAGGGTSAPRCWPIRPRPRSTPPAPPLHAAASARGRADLPPAVGRALLLARGGDEAASHGRLAEIMLAAVTTPPSIIDAARLLREAARARPRARQDARQPEALLVLGILEVWARSSWASRWWPAGRGCSRTPWGGRSRRPSDARPCSSWENPFNTRWMRRAPTPACAARCPWLRPAWPLLRRRLRSVP
ncbi:MAG: MBL fold metallo-hydrolase [bacterium]